MVEIFIGPRSDNVSGDDGWGDDEWENEEENEEFDY